MSDDKNKTFNSSLTDEHVREAERLKKAWFDHVFNSIERLGENVEKISSDLQATRGEFYKEISEAKEILRKETVLLHKDIDIDIDKVEKRLNKTIDGINKSIDSISFKEIRDELKIDLTTVKEELRKEIDTVRKAVVPLKDDVVKLRITIAKWGGLGGLIVSLLLFAIRWIIPIIISGLAHKP